MCSVLSLKTEKLNNYLHSCNTYLMSGVLVMLCERNTKSNEQEIIAKGHQVRKITFLYQSWSRLVFLLQICLFELPQIALSIMSYITAIKNSTLKNFSFYALNHLLPTSRSISLLYNNYCYTLYLLCESTRQHCQ